MEAWKRIRAKRAHGGVDHVSVDDFTTNAEARLDELRRELLEERYVPEPLQQIAIQKAPGSKEQRILGLPAVRDKIAQEALRSVIEPRMERLFLDCSYGYRPGKGTHRAIARATHYLTAMKRRWIVTADIDDFFGSIDHTLLINRLRPMLQDEVALTLIQLWLKMGTIDSHGRWKDVFSGISQGGVISPLLANFYLHPFDQSLVDQKLGMVRYADDFVILCADRTEAEDALLKATDYLNNRLSLRLNPSPRPITALEEGFSFLGIFFQNNRHLIDPTKLDRIAAKVRRLTAKPHSSDFAKMMREMNEAIAGWRRYYGTIVAQGEMEKVERIIREGIIRLIAWAFHQGTFKTISDGEAALQGLELLIERGPQERQAFITTIVREGRTAKLPVTQHNASVSSPHAVATKVRAKKRKHQRSLAQISELVINTPGCFLGKTGQRVVVRQNRKNLCEIPALQLTGITIASRGIALSADVIDHCAANDIPLLFLSPHGKVVAVLSAPNSSKGAVNLCQLQTLSDGKPAIELCKQIVGGKIKNQMNLMKYFHKYRKQVDPPFAEAFPVKLSAMGKILEELKGVIYSGDYEAARGHLFSIEGRAASHYWDIVGLLLNGRADFQGRKRQGATDLVNSLLNYGYAMLHARVYLSILKAGLTPEISFLHSLQKGKPTLVYDLMEEFRPQVVDRTVFTMLTRREKAKITDQGLLTDETRRRLIAQVQDRLATIIRFRSRELKLDEVIQHQTQLLVRHLKGEKAYRSFVGKW